MSSTVDKFIGASALLYFFLTAPLPAWGLYPPAVSPPFMARPKPVSFSPSLDWSKNIAHIALDVERALRDDYILIDLDRGVITMKDNQALLERIFSAAEKQIPVRDSYSKDQALEAVEIIYRIIKEEGFEYRDYCGDGYFYLGCHLFGYGLAKREIDCVSYCILALGIAERLNLPLNGIFMPGHFALRWHLDGRESMDIEMTVPAKCDDDYYITWKDIPHESVNKGIYLRDLTREEVIAQQLYSLSLVWERRAHFEKALDTVNYALRLFNRFPDALNLRGIIYRRLGEYAKALCDFDTVLLMDVTFSEARDNRLNALTRLLSTPKTNALSSEYGDRLYLEK